MGDANAPTNVGSLNPPAAQTPVSAPPATPATPPNVTATPASKPPTPPIANPTGTLGATSAEPVPTLVQRASAADAKPIPPILKKDGQDIVPAPPKPEIVGMAGATQIKSDGMRLKTETIDVNPQNPSTPEGYVIIQPNPDGKPWSQFRGVCKKCGFQSFQPSEKEARQMIVNHAVKHLLGI